MIYLELGSFLYACPSSWVKFIRYMEKVKAEKNSDGGFSIETINRFLDRFGAYYEDKQDGTGQVVFKSKNHYLTWVLIYGDE